MASLRDDPRTGTSVSCPSCAREIPLTASPRRQEEFSVPCPHCGRRNLFGSADAHDMRDSEKIAKTFGTVRFITGKPIEEAMPTGPKSWLNGCTSWLLQ